MTPSRMRYSVVLLTLALTAASARLGLDSSVVIAAITFAGTYTTASKAGEVMIHRLGGIKSKLVEPLEPPPSPP